MRLLVIFMLSPCSYPARSALLLNQAIQRLNTSMSALPLRSFSSWPHPIMDPAWAEPVRLSGRTV